MVSDFEQHLFALDAKLDEVQKAGKAVVAAIGRSRAAVKVGRVADIARGLGTVVQRLDEANAAAAGLASSWTFDASAYLADGRFFDDLKTAAAERGLALFESDGRGRAAESGGGQSGVHLRCSWRGHVGQPLTVAAATRNRRSTCCARQAQSRNIRAW